MIYLLITALLLCWLYLSRAALKSLLAGDTTLTGTRPWQHRTGAMVDILSVPGQTILSTTSRLWQALVAAACYCWGQLVRSLKSLFAETETEEA